jgi:superfamily II DNA/RNA helicase
VGAADLAGLIRQLLRSESILRRGDIDARVPKGPGWPTREQWEASSVDVRVDHGSSFRVAARSWSPSWLTPDFDDSIGVLRNRCRSDERGTPADPVVKTELGIATFRSAGQAAAMRAVAFLPRQETLLVGLPTGSGKSLLFQAAAIRAARQGETTVIVVPTTALAIDQEERFKGVLSRGFREQAAYPLAYHSGLNPQVKQAIRHRLRSGEQCIVIASPEAIVGALRVSLERLAADGRLAWLVVDEVHMVSQWGDNFRPEYQLLAALVAGWRACAPKERQPRTLLLSATISNDCLETLRALFTPLRSAEPGLRGRPDAAAFHVLVAPQLRAEPQYWLAAAPNPMQRRAWVAEALLHAPRPIIAYTAKRTDAEQLAADLETRLGFRRVALFRGGDAATAVGAEKLKAWNDGDVDIVVATSAFGLGMDNTEVRTVIHACVPETVDRFYQEVGRGGRDGRPSLSLWIHAPQDVDVARDLGRKRLIGLDRGWARWKGMNARAEPVPELDDASSLRLDDTPHDRHEENDANRAWNLRTLILMMRAGLISLGTPKVQLPEKTEQETDADFEARRNSALQEMFGRIVVIREHSLTKEKWEHAVHALRAVAKQREQDDHRRLKELLAVSRPFANILAETYSLDLGQQELSPTPFPGQCPVTRGHRAAALSRQPAEFGFTKDLLAGLSAVIPGLPGGGVHWIAYTPPSSARNEIRRVRDRLNAAIRVLVREGVLEVAVPEQFELDESRLLNVSPQRYLAVRGLQERDPPRLNGVATELPLPRLTLLPYDTRSGLAALDILSIDRPLHVVLVPDTLADPHRADRLFLATRTHDRLDSLLERWSL